MVLKLSQKQQIVSLINNTANTSISLIIADVSGIKVNDLNIIRSECRKIKEITLFISRNSLLIKSLQNTVFSHIIHLLKGQCMLGFTNNTPDITSKIFFNYEKQLHKSIIKGVCVENKLYTNENIDILINLPNHKGALIKFLYCLQNISIGNLYCLLFKLI